MKTITLLILTATVATANSLPPTPENSLPPVVDMINTIEA